MQLELRLFHLLSNQIPKQVLSIKPQASCQLFVRRAIPTQEKIINLEEQQFSNHHVLLSTSGQYVFEVNSETKKVMSGFKCDFDVKFWVKRAPAIVANTVGKVQGIAFQFTDQAESRTLSLFLDEDSTQDKIKCFQSFTSVLERKYIVQKQFHQKYKAIKRIGKGVTANVYSSLCLIDRSQVAIKSFKKELYFNQDNGNGKKGFLKEFKILTEVRCKYLAKLLGVYESDQSIYIVQELYDRTLHNYLNKFGFLETTPSRRLLYQLLIGLKFLHQRRIMHRDIKLENIMIRGPNKDNIEPVIVDFGLAQYENTKQFVYIRCGTPGYVAPQVVNLGRDEKTQLKYDKSCDIFSMGVIFHIILLGKTVFEGEQIRQVVQKNKACLLDYEFKSYPRLSPQIKDLLVGMLNVQPQKRYTVQQLMNHVFFREQKDYFSKEVQTMEQQMFTEQRSHEENRMKEE